MTDQEINESVARKLGYVIRDGRIFWEAVENDVQAEAHPIPNYCHSIEAAWECAEKIGPSFNLFRDWDSGKWTIRLTDGSLRIGAKEKAEYIEADTAPMAICLAFLKLVV